MTYKSEWRCKVCERKGYSKAEKDGLAVKGCFADHKIKSPNCPNDMLRIKEPIKEQ